MRFFKVLLITVLLFSFQSGFVSAQAYKSYARGGTLIIHNNTDATLTIEATSGSSMKIENEATVLPNQKLELRRWLPQGKNRVSARASKVRPRVGAISEIFWVSGPARKVHEWYIYPKNFGKSFLADAGGGGEMEPGISGNMLNNTNLLGNDYNKDDVVLSRADPALCQKKCNNQSKCMAWTYVRPNTRHGDKPECWLKHSVPIPSKRKKNICCVSGIKSGGNHPKGRRADCEWRDGGLFGPSKCICGGFEKANSFCGH